MDGVELVYTFEEVSRILKVPTDVVDALVCRGKIPYVMIGEELRIRGTDLKNFVDSRCAL